MARGGKQPCLGASFWPGSCWALGCPLAWHWHQGRASEDTDAPSLKKRKNKTKQAEIQQVSHSTRAAVRKGFGGFHEHISDFRFRPQPQSVASRPFASSWGRGHVRSWAPGTLHGTGLAALGAVLPKISVCPADVRICICRAWVPSAWGTLLRWLELSAHRGVDASAPGATTPWAQWGCPAPTCPATSSHHGAGILLHPSPSPFRGRISKVTSPSAVVSPTPVPVPLL